MGISNRERIVVGVAALLFFAAFGALALLDRPHGSQGDAFGENDFTVEIDRNQGHLTIPDLPSDLLIFGPGQEAVLDFTVTNNDEDNDIDTIFITIPGAEMTNATIEWYDTLFDHDWEYTAHATDIAKLTASDDLPGRVFGGSAQYDVAGNIDDALDHNSTIGISEGLTVTLEFTTPSMHGVKVGSDAINLEVGDQQTENDGSTEKFSVDPFPYPYTVVAQGFEFIVYQVEGADMDVEMGGQRIFGSGSRASEFTTSQFGYKYISENGNTVIVLEAPIEGTVVNPIIIAQDDLGGQYTIDMVHYTTGVIDTTQPSSSWVEVETSQTGYTGDLPATAGEMVSLDIDGDGLFTDNDGDIDGDGITNDQDSDPYNGLVVNHIPTIEQPTSSADEIAKNKKLQLSVVAVDDDSDTLSYTWTVAPATGWTGAGAEPEVDLGDFEPGTYTFTVVVEDGNGGSAQETITVEVTKAEEETSTTIFIIIAIVVVLLIIIVIVVLVMRGNSDEEIEAPPMEGPPEISETYEDPIMEESYEAPPTQEEETYPEEYVSEPVSPVEEEYPVYEETVEAPLIEEEEEDEISDLESLIGEMEEIEEEVGDECPECGQILGPTDSQCAACGAQFEVALECPGCGVVVEENVTTCPSCGVSFGTD